MGGGVVWVIAVGDGRRGFVGDGENLLFCGWGWRFERLIAKDDMNLGYIYILG